MDVLRRWTRVLGSTAVICSALVGRPATAQETLLERWTVGQVADGWAQRWGVLDATRPWWDSAGGLGSDDDACPQISASVGGDVLSLRETLHEGHSSAAVELCKPLGRDLSLRVASSSGSWRTEAADRPVLTTPRSESVSGGLELTLAGGPIGRFDFSAMGGWDNGPGGIASIESRSTHHDVLLSAWHTDARAVEVLLPADSLRDMGVRQSAKGGEIRLRLTIPVGPLEVRPAAEWKREVLAGSNDVDSVFLSAPADGSHTQVRAGLSVVGGGWGGAVDYRERTIDLAAPILRVDASAGTVRRAPMELWGWRAAAWRRAGSRSWSLEGGSDQMSGEVSARIETWPFVSLWESLSAQAYRFNGAVAARSAWIRLRSQSMGSVGWSWGAEVGRYRLQADRDSWYVTSLGFGRSERVQTTDGADPAVFIGGEIAKSWPTRLGTWGATLAGGVPVYGKSLDGSAAEPGDGRAGYLSVMMDWAR